MDTIENGEGIELVYFLAHYRQTYECLETPLSKIKNNINKYTDWYIIYICTNYE